MNLKEIKDAARQAFRDQQSQDTEGGVPDAISFCAGFLAGARHRQDEIGELKQVNDDLVKSNVSIFVMDYIQQGLDIHYSNKIKKLKREIEVLRQYGNKDCTAMADEVLENE